MNKTIQLSQLENIRIDGIFWNDCPRFCDAFVSSATLNGVPLTDEQLEPLEDDCEAGIYIHELALAQHYALARELYELDW
jgi:hypothetical protein